MEAKEIFNMTISELEHSGVKGMKWGQSKRKGITIESRATSNTRVNDKRDAGYKSAPGASALILMVVAKRGDKKRANKIIENTLKTPISELNKKSLKEARDLVNQFDNFEIKTSQSKDWKVVN